MSRTLVHRTRFMVDVSRPVQTTTISIMDSSRFHLYNVIPSPTTSTSTRAGHIPTSVLHDCGLVFPLGHSAIVEFLSQINILNPPPPIPHNIWSYWSIIGRDVLDTYRVTQSSDGSSITLEK
jgi:hypothetical protein